MLKDFAASLGLSQKALDLPSAAIAPSLSDPTAGDCSILHSVREVNRCGPDLEFTCQDASAFGYFDEVHLKFIK